MTSRVLTILLIIVIFTGISGAGAEMSSTNFKIPYSVLSSGGEFKSSTNFEAEDTLGQPTPLMEDEFVPSSTNYRNYPGIWYLLAGISKCPGDYNGDLDVDGSDLKEHIMNPAGVSLADFAANFGKVDCQ
jgi:hypothetical protein